MRKASNKKANTTKSKNDLQTNAKNTTPVKSLTDTNDTNDTNHKKTNNNETIFQSEEDCKCLKIMGHLESVKWKVYPRDYRPSPGHLAMGDWTRNPFIWLYHVENSNGILADDDVLLSADTRYWEIEDVQRYYRGMVHCENVMFTYQYPYLRMPTPLGSLLWKSCTAYKTQSNEYRSEIHCSLEMTLKKMVVSQAQMDRLIIPDRIIKIDRLDYFRRESFFRLLYDILSFQDRLQLASFENMGCHRLEGVGLIQRLACFNAETLKYLFLWKFVLPSENPILINYTYITGSGQYIPRPDTRHIFLRSLGELRNLRVLALEYAHIADGTGGALLSLLPVIKRAHFRLQLMCRDDQIPGCVDAALGAGGYDIPDTAWRRVTIACPDLYLLLAFFRIRDYDNIRRFLTPSMPLREVHLQLGIDLKLCQRQDSDVSCFIRHIAYRYADTLVTLSIQQWRFVVFPLRRVFELMPRLVRFFYVGMVEDEDDLKRLFNIIACGVCALPRLSKGGITNLLYASKWLFPFGILAPLSTWCLEQPLHSLYPRAGAVRTPGYIYEWIYVQYQNRELKQVKIQIQDDDARKAYWRKVVESLTEEFSDIMQLYNITFCISIYKH